MKNLKFGVFMLGLAVVYTACSSDDDTAPTQNKGALKIVASASYGNSNNRMKTNSLDENREVSLSSFIVNFEEIELELADADEDNVNNFYGSDDDIELEGPFEYDLLSGDSFPLVDIKIPNGIYEKIEFEFDKSEDSNSDLLGKSIKMTGLINGKPFVFWHDFEEEIEIDFEDADKSLVIDNNANEVVINFDLNAVVGSNGMIDLSAATDNNGDGVITISPEDEDGNNGLAESIKEAIKARIELLDDQD